ncbi:class Ib ribonucleoside-diphosphate reductase assembly flavoprotein NrdI [Mycoplasmoides gallisepticum]|uniref:class Ib ribonucleoside-diphosphate reductase assembly flavoprotein NrdI n=1 Tax=Mycoplasmoides gallisepticum TaxID=2096 RepID=UPI0012480864|nr:class Ib ribonucleoside-diphosphate reductase assembly flavoprotein NrdI [Mycoplasmoides gallisepticum]QEX47001.1 class Ib ribonucleoside-diphosphate reductase assembly flavoprotein NrdI [Mycoplasmoides gallisepticum]ULH62306.1 class Ib ribonucleoside-diphosphate reductase assembly flavoprotein NrdI [Mycoplasmoides gallisepticum]ULH67645.1 class Ib ribonucleoside-diphosphate reductase assembly flavoprotein NrdI [Mycoplasmoides gallisepticum]ULH68372.1 class Ib ribonucleoside-diphosphate redu
MENTPKLNVPKRKPTGEMRVVYFSSTTENTKKFCDKLGLPATRIPIKLSEEIEVDYDYVLICPTYAGGLDDFKGSVPRQVIKFLNKVQNREHCVGVVASGNTNFGETFGLAGHVLRAKLHVPLLHVFELIGTKYDEELIRERIHKLWNWEE